MGDRRAAEGELLVAAERLGLYTNGQGGKQATEELSSARQDLRQLAEQIGRESSKVSPRDIDQAASRAQSAMAMLFADRVQNEKGSERAIEAGYDLQSAAIHAREALLWTDQNVPDKTAHFIRQAMQTADDLITGNSQSSRKADQIEQTLARDITQIDKQDEESQAQPAGEQTPGKQSQKASENADHESNSRSS
jgi:hypothetical protein